MKLKVNRGVTLIEVLATITISGILFSIIGTIIGTFNVSFERSKYIRQIDEEIQVIENAISVCVEYSNINGYELIINDNDEAIYLNNVIDGSENIIFKFDRINKTLDLSFSNTTRKLKYIESISIKKSNDVGIVLEIITIENVKKQSYYNIINLR